MTEQRVEPAGPRQPTHHASGPPRPVASWTLAAVSVVVLAASYWLAVQPGAAEAQTGFMTWINDPPPLLGEVLALTNRLLRPIPLTLLAVAFLAWLMSTTRGGGRWEVIRAIVLSFVVAEAITQVLKRTANQSRPTATIPGLDVHGYPKDPFGNAFPSAHTSVAVGLLTALWPWLTLPQRVVGIVAAALVALNRLYIGAHWPLDVVGGAAIGLLAGALCWLVATRWPLRRPAPQPVEADPEP